jgi:ribosomal 30S subunit maturation factor RimM
MEDLGDQVAYLVLSEGTDVYASDETRVGTVKQVLAAGNDDIFDGLMVSDGLMNQRYVPADSVDAIYERGVVLKLDEASFKQQPHRA